MRIVYDLPQAALLPPLKDEGRRGYVTIGVFDGVHRGHQQLIAETLEAARSANGVAIAITFDPHPAVALGRASESPLLLTTTEERVALLAELGLDLLVVLSFTAATAHTPAADFVGDLVRHLRLAELWVGPDFALGHRREGDISFLRRLGEERGFGVQVVEPLVWEGAPVSSSRVRAALRAGDLRQATGCLGRPYRLTGLVARGDGRGRRIGAPTANLSLSPDRLLPGGGVYACLAHTERLGTHSAVVNVGARPTFAGLSDNRELTVEAHLLDFDADLRGQRLALDFIARLRDERAFPDTDALTAQIDKDIAQARAVLGV